MSSIGDFSIWLKAYTSLSDSSIYKYTHAVSTISEAMLHNSVIKKSLAEMDVAELDTSLMQIFFDQYFVTKNTTGNNMYSSALKYFRLFAYEASDNMSYGKEIVDSINHDTNMTVTERAAIISARIGQGVFRKQLLEKYDSTCIITHINDPRLLIASHIKPWAVSSNEERISTENGLLLSPTFDRMFDSGLISFEGDGRILVSSSISTANISRLHIASHVFNIRASKAMATNLEYHRDIIFVK